MSLLENSDSEHSHVSDLVSRFIRPTKSLAAGIQHNIDKREGGLGSLLRWYSDHQEVLVGVDLTPGHIRLCQMEDNNGHWKLATLASESIPGEFTTKDMRDHSDKYIEKLKKIIQRNNVKATNAAVAIPVSDSIIKTISLPTMTDEEIGQAIELGSFWQNLVQLPGDLNEYSVFYEVVKRDEDNDIMDIIFVASRKEDIKLYTDIIEAAGLKPIIVDVRCFALNNLFHINSQNTNTQTPVVFLKFGPDENYIHIIDQGESFIYDIYISDEERQTIMDHLNDAEILQRYATQAKQIISIHESKHSDSKIENIFIVSLLPSIKSFINKLSVMLNSYKVSECNFFDHIEIPHQLAERIEEEDNRSAWAVAMGLAARKLDVFDHYKGMSGADNVNLLPGNEQIKKTKRVNLRSTAGLVSITSICLMVAIISISSVMDSSDTVEGKLAVVSQVDSLYNQQFIKVKRLHAIEKRLVSLEAIRAEVASNQANILSAYKHLNSAVPEGVWLTELSFESPDRLKIMGNSMSDQNVLQFLRELKSEDVFSRASLKTMHMNSKFDAYTEDRVKSFSITATIAGLKPIEEQNISGGQN